MSQPLTRREHSSDTLELLLLRILSHDVLLPANSPVQALASQAIAISQRTPQNPGLFSSQQPNTQSPLTASARLIAPSFATPNPHCEGLRHI